MELVLLIFAALLPAVLLIYYVFRKDSLHPEPRGQLIKGFFFGVAAAGLVMAVMAPFAGFLQQAAQTSVAGAVFQAFCGAAIPEELSKLLMLWLLVRSNKYFDENIDGIVYAVCVGMGFAGFENILYLIRNYDAWLAVGSVRALISVPGHFFFAVTMGYYFSLAHFGDKTRKRTNLCLAIVVPILMHGIFDSILMSASILPTLGLILTVCFFFCFKKIRLFASGKLKELYDIDRNSFES